MQIKKLAFFAILLTVVFTGCEDKETISADAIVSKNDTTKAVTQKTHDKVPKTFALKTHDSKEIFFTPNDKGWIFEQYKGKAILLDFFGTWCPPCKKEIPHLNNLRKHFDGKFEIIALDIGNRDGSMNTPEQLADFIKQYDIKYPITFGKINNEIFASFRATNPNGSIPFMVLLTPNGDFAQPYVGMVSEKVLKADIQKVLELKAK